MVDDLGPAHDRFQDDVDNPAEGRMKAVMQTTPWFLWLASVDEEEEEED